MTWTQNKLFLPQHPAPRASKMPRPQPLPTLNNDMTASEMVRVLSMLAFSNTDLKRTIQISRVARDKLVKALNLIGVVQ